MTMLSLSRTTGRPIIRLLSKQQLPAASTRCSQQSRVGVAALSSSTNQYYFSTTTSPRSSSPDSDAPTFTYEEKGWLGKLMDRISIKGQQRRILLGESLFQAATRQANDP